MTEYAIALTHAPASAPGGRDQPGDVDCRADAGRFPALKPNDRFHDDGGKALLQHGGYERLRSGAGDSHGAFGLDGRHGLPDGDVLQGRGARLCLVLGFAGPNLQYVGGTLSPMAVPKGSSCPNITSTLQVRNMGTANTTLNSNSFFTFTDGTNTFTAYLECLHRGRRRRNSLAFVRVSDVGRRQEAAWRSILPLPTGRTHLVELLERGSPVRRRSAPVSGNVTVAGTCSAGGTLRILVGGEVVR